MAHNPNKPIPHNELRHRNKIEQHEHCRETDARRVSVVDITGAKVSDDNPLPVSTDSVKIYKYSHNAMCMIEFCGEASPGSAEDDLAWFIQKFEYDSNCNMNCVLTASNTVTTKATSVTVDTSSNSPEVRIEITGGLFDMVEAGDVLVLTTGSNSINAVINSKLSTTEVLVTDNAAVDETSTAIGDEDLLVTLADDGIKERRWDKREFYIYS